MVLRGILAGAAWLALAGFAPVEPRPLASINVSVAEDGAHVAVKLDRPVSRFAFAPGFWYGQPRCDAGRCWSFESPIRVDPSVFPDSFCPGQYSSAKPVRIRD